MLIAAAVDSWDNLREGSENSLGQNAANAERLPNTLSVVFPGVYAAEMLKRHPDLCASTASACHSGDSTVSPTLSAIGLDAERL